MDNRNNHCYKYFNEMNKIIKYNFEMVQIGTIYSAITDAQSCIDHK